MIQRLALVLLVLLLVAARSLAQEGEEPLRLPLRVQRALGAGRLVIDRGAGDRLLEGDRVHFYPREGGAHHGRIVELEERSAVVELEDRRVELAAGTRGEARVPAGRYAARQEQDEGAAAVPEPLPWETGEEGWTPDMPLLARIGALRPQERPSTLVGRLYLIGDFRDAADSGRGSTFLRFGQDLELDNPFGRGGLLQIDLEQNWRSAELAYARDEDGELDLRVDRFSYTLGGTRFEDRRLEVGRFLQATVPELGVLDGLSFDQRLGHGDRFGGSVGFLPEPDGERQSGHDFQLAAWYRWVSDVHEQLAFTGALQKSFHDGSADRDLFLGRVEYLPQGPWSFHATTWVDWYDGREDEHDSGFELTRAQASLAHRWDSGDEARLSYRRQRFAELERDEYPGQHEEELAGARDERLALDLTTVLGPRRRLFAGAGVWQDEEDEGADGELGIEERELWLRGSVLGLALFGAEGRFSRQAGGRVSFGRWIGAGRWDLMYELAASEQEGFDEEGDVVQHRLRASRDFLWGSGWTLSAYAEGYLWDGDQAAWALGFYLQKGL